MLQRGIRLIGGLVKFVLHTCGIYLTLVLEQVDPMPYYDICTLHLEDEKVCSVAMAYVKSCMMNSIPVRIPAYCVK